MFCSDTSNKHFLLFDVKISFDSSFERIIGWGNYDLIHMAKGGPKHYFIDCTFKSVPKPFYQCMIIMIYENATESYIPMFYVLMQSKYTGAYNAALYHCICHIGRNKFDAITVTCDFEQALITAINDNIENAVIIGCLFHWKQAMRRKMLQLHIHETLISEIMDVNGIINILPEVPISDIETKAIPYIRQNFNTTLRNGRSYDAEFERFWKYFIDTWMTKYPPRLWNIHAMVCHLSGDINSTNLNSVIINRTNNGLERFNRKLNTSFPCSHPNMRTFVNTIRSMSLDYVDTYTRIKNKLELPHKHQQLTTYIIPNSYTLFVPPVSTTNLTKHSLLAKYSNVINCTHWDCDDKILYRVIDIDFDSKNNIIGKRIQHTAEPGKKAISDWVGIDDILKYMQMQEHEL